MGHLLNNDEPPPHEQCDFDLCEIQNADEAKVEGEGWVKIKELSITNKGICIMYETDGPFDEGHCVDCIQDLR